MLIVLIFFTVNLNQRVAKLTGRVTRHVRCDVVNRMHAKTEWTNCIMGPEICGNPTPSPAVARFCWLLSGDGNSAGVFATAAASTTYSTWRSFHFPTVGSPSNLSINQRLLSWRNRQMHNHRQISEIKSIPDYGTAVRLRLELVWAKCCKRVELASPTLSQWNSEVLIDSAQKLDQQEWKT